MSQCRGCGKKIVWGLDADNKRIPLDPVPPVYEITEANSRTLVERADRKRFMVSHFATCSQANQFSGKGKK